MHQELAQIDPEWAWAEFDSSTAEQHESRKSSSFDHRRVRLDVAHLFRRAGFACPTDEFRQANANRSEAVDRLMQGTLDKKEFEEDADQFATSILASGNPKRLSAAWAYRMLHTPDQLLEKMTLFWHGHFATGAEKVQDARMMWNQNALLRRFALGDFRRLTQAVAQDPAMLVYLDSDSNRKSHPNENFARELMELFCLGEGNYSEKDVQELARCFTGWEIRRGKFRKNRYQQDKEEKTVLGRTGAFDGEEGVDIVVRHPAASFFICRKLCQFLVLDEPLLDERLIRPLADQLVNSEMDVAPVVQRILKSNLFYSPIVRARKIRSPVELIVGLLRGLHATTNAVQVADGLNSIGQGLFYPPNVKGWPGGRTWINASNLLGRSNLIAQILSDSSTRFGGGNLEEYFESMHCTNGRQVIDLLETTFLAVELNGTTRERLVDEIEGGASSKRSRNERLVNAVRLLTTLPEFQLA